MCLVATGRGALKLLPASPPILLEVCLDRAAVAADAARAGARRLEVCADLQQDGLTPDFKLLEMVREQCELPIMAMVRPRPSDFRLEARELEEMHRDLERLCDWGVEGVVFGMLTVGGELPTQEIGALLEAAGPLPVTFHRAFDHCIEPIAGLGQLAELGVRRVLTSGRPGRATDHLPLLRELGALAQSLDQPDRPFDLLPGGNVRAANADAILTATGARELHSSATADWAAWFARARH